MFKKFCAYLHLIPPIKSSAVVNLHFVFVLLLCHQFKPQKSFVCGRHLLFFDGVQGTHNRKFFRDLILNKIMRFLSRQREKLILCKLDSTTNNVLSNLYLSIMLTKK